MNEAYDDKQFVGIKRASATVGVGTDDSVRGVVGLGAHPQRSGPVRSGDGAGRRAPGGGVGSDLLLVLGLAMRVATIGANVHLAHPLGVKAFSYRQVKNDAHDAGDLADLLRSGRLPEAWIAPPATRELRELVQHRAEPVHARSSLRCQFPAVLAGQGVPVSVSDLFGVAGVRTLG